jgi:hypothetical protein
MRDKQTQGLADRKKSAEKLNDEADDKDTEA